MTIKDLRILPPLAIGRLGSADEPLDNYTIDLDPDPDQPLGYRAIRPQPTLVVDPHTGEITGERTPKQIEFKTWDKIEKREKIRPVAPFLEVFAVTDGGKLEPLTLDLLQENALKVGDISWHVAVANRKVMRRTDDPDDLVRAETEFSDHQIYTLKGHCKNFVGDKFVDFGQVRFIKPTPDFPQIRLRFTPAKGLIYGPDRHPRPARTKSPDANAPKQSGVPDDQAVYDHTKSWYRFGDPDPKRAKKRSRERFRNETLPPSLYAIEPPAPSWLYDNIAISRGYLDDACDGFVEVRLKLKDGREPKELKASARIIAAPPALAPDSLFVRCLADDLEQVVHGPEVSPHDETPAETLAKAQDIVRRAYETVRFMNVAVMNGNDFKGRPALSLDSMPEEEAADTERAIRPIMSPGTVDTFAIMMLHQQAFAALRGGAAPWFVRLLRRPDEVADFTDNGRRKMPALMCGADNSYLALTWRQIDTIKKAARHPPSHAPQHAPAHAVRSGLTPRNLSAQINYAARGNPINSRPVTSVANCCPGLETDFRAVWRRMFRGIVLREYDNLVVEVDRDCDKVVVPVGQNDTLKPSLLAGHRLLRVVLPGAKDRDVWVTTEIKGPASSDPEGYIILTTNLNPNGLAPLEWSNALARVVQHKNGRVRCDFSAEESPDQQQPLVENPQNYVSFEFEVQPFFEESTAVISRALAEAGELTQGLCSPWQNDYRECSCYYWASARPDYVNIELDENGLSTGDNWMQKHRTGSYVADDYVDARLIMYDDLFRNWETLLKFQVGGRDLPDPTADGIADKTL